MEIKLVFDILDSSAVIVASLLAIFGISSLRRETK